MDDDVAYRTAGSDVEAECHEEPHALGDENSVEANMNSHVGISNVNSGDDMVWNKNSVLRVSHPCMDGFRRKHPQRKLGSHGVKPSMWQEDVVYAPDTSLFLGQATVQLISSQMIQVVLQLLPRKQRSPLNVKSSHLHYHEQELPRK
jgi:hypothetical protein